MARKLRLQFEGALYHVTVRGNARGALFRDDRDRDRMLDRLAQASGDYEVDVLMYCLMANHVHLLVGTPRANLSAFMGSVLTGYSVYFNLRHRRVGHLTQGRFSSPLVEGDAYLLRLSRYLHLNPVFTEAWIDKPLAARIAEVRRYPWSSYRGYAGLAKPADWVRREPILDQVTAGARRPELAYRRYVEAGLADTDEEFIGILHQSPHGIGSEAFLERLRDQYQKASSKHARLEDVALRREARRLSIATVDGLLAEHGLGLDLTSLQRRDCTPRMLAVHAYTRHAGLTQREVAKRLGMRSGSSVSQQLRLLRARLVDEPGLRRRIAAIDASANRYFKG
ncbi:MAG: transposase [Lentisphaerae bacterium]|nr:transposase [Lentisphaerota bacterium]